MTTIRVITAPGTRASKVGEVYASYSGVSWGNSVDRVDDDGCGRVFLTCDDDEVAEYVREMLENDEAVTYYEDR